MQAVQAPAKLQFIKLGGSLITDKRTPHTPRAETLARLAGEIASVFGELHPPALLLGHGSGSFGHVPARQYATRQGVYTAEAWRGFVAVWREAAALNRMVMDALQAAGLPAIAFPPSASVMAEGGNPAAWELRPIRLALEVGLLPVIFGDVVFDTRRGGTILSTEDLFAWLARQLLPKRILLAGLESGVWADFPACTRLIPEITPHNYAHIAASLGGSHATDVTGGMAAKVQQTLALVQSIGGGEALIFSGEQPGTLARVLRGEAVGTAIRLG